MSATKGCGVGLVCVLVLFACTPAAYLNNTVSLGGSTPGGRGSIQVGFINETPYRAIFTYGTYDPQNLDQDGSVSFTPGVGQFFVDADAANRLEGNSSSDVVTFDCGRALSLGGDQLIALIVENDLDGGLDPTALQPGIAFSGKPIDDPEGDQPTAGTAAAVVTLQGAEYQCESLLIYTFKLDAGRPECLAAPPLADGCFLVELDVILP